MTCTNPAYGLPPQHYERLPPTTLAFKIRASSQSAEPLWTRHGGVHVAVVDVPPRRCDGEVDVGIGVSARLLDVARYCAA